MKRFLSLLCIVLLGGCAKEYCGSPNKPSLISVNFRVTQGDLPFSGALEVFPCTLNTSTYFGNYRNGNLTVFNPSYVISGGAITAIGYPLMLPVGNYTFLYWGVESSASYQDGVSRPGSLSLGADMNNVQWSLISNPDGTYRPAYNQCFAVKNVNVGKDSIDVALHRVVAGLNVVVEMKSGVTLNDNILEFNILVNGIARQLNYVDGHANFSGGTVTVQFPLTININRLEASNLTAMLYPSTPTPQITLQAILADGSIKSYTTTLSNPLTANQVQTITVVVDQITGGAISSSGFTINQWTETSQTIDAGTLN